MGGTLRVTSDVGEGSTFTITLPVALAPAPAVTPSLFSGTAEWSHLRVLLAEDNPVNMLVQKKILTKLGVTFDVAADGREAVELASANRYDVILLDLQMPVMDGLQAAKTLRQQRPEHVADRGDRGRDHRNAHGLHRERLQRFSQQAVDRPRRRGRL